MKKKHLSLLLSLLFAVALSLSGITYALANEPASGSLFAASYELGETISIPSHDISAEGATVAATAFVVYPDGHSVSADSVKLTDAGVYTVEYRALVNGKVRKESYTFEVGYPKYSVTAKSDEVEYKTVTVGNASVEGLYVKIGGSSTFTCHQAIDLSKVNGEIIKLFVVPDTAGSADCEYFYIQLTDALDSSNYITLAIRQSPTSDSVIYGAAKAHNQSQYYGVERGFEGGEPLSKPWGFAATGSFMGTAFGKKGFEIGIRYDNDTQTLRMNNNTYADSGDYVIDFNNTDAFTEGWSGFKSGKVVVSAYASSFYKSNMGFVITSLSQVDLSESNLTLTEPSGLDIDFGDYSADSYPHAVIGRPYKIFDAAPLSLYTAEKVYVTVKTSYGSSAAMDVTVKDGCFTPLKAVTHTIVYTVTDGFGNVKEYPVPVTVDSDYEEISFNLDTSPITIDVGSTIKIPAATALNGGNGNLSAKITLVKSGAEGGVEITEASHKFTESGSFTLDYEVSDYNGCSKKKQIAVTVNAAQKPLFTYSPELPMRMIKGGKYSVPALYAEDYSSGSLQTVEAVAQVYVNNSVATLENGYFTVTGGSKVKIVYTATDALKRTNTVEYSIPVVDTGLKGNLDLTKYFLTENGEVVTSGQALSFKASGADASATFIRELNGRLFELTFAMKSGQTGYSSVEIVLTDTADSEKQVKIAITSDGGSAAVSINGSKAVKTSYAFSGNVTNYEMELDGNSLLLCDTYFTIKTYADGSAFGGFEKFVYLTINLNDCEGTSAIELSKLNKQPLNNELGSDITKPNVMHLGNAAKGSAEINDVISIDPVIAVDVLDPFATITLSVRLPSNEYATAEDGTLLHNVPADKVYTLKIGEYGSYKFDYYCSDSNENEDKSTSIISCTDKVAPVVTVKQTSMRARVGSALSAPSYEVSDNYYAKDKITVQIQIITPESVIVTYDAAKGYTFEKAGTYVIRYFAFDGAYNLTYTDVTCVVS